MWGPVPAAHTQHNSDMAGKVEIRILRTRIIRAPGVPEVVRPERETPVPVDRSQQPRERSRRVSSLLRIRVRALSRRVDFRRFYAQKKKRIDSLAFEFNIYDRTLAVICLAVNYNYRVIRRTYVARLCGRAPDFRPKRFGYSITPRRFVVVVRDR